MNDSARVEVRDGCVSKNGRTNEIFLWRGGVLSGVGGLFGFDGVTKADLKAVPSETTSSAVRISPLLAPGGVGGRCGEVGKMAVVG